MVPEPLHNYLLMHRKRSGLAQRELAVLLGCKHGSKVSRYERGLRQPSLDALVVYEVVFGESTTRLFAGVTVRTQRQVRERAQVLFKKLDGHPKLTPALKRKLDFLADIIYPPSRT